MSLLVRLPHGGSVYEHTSRSFPLMLTYQVRMSDSIPGSYHPTITLIYTPFVSLKIESHFVLLEFAGSFVPCLRSLDPEINLPFCFLCCYWPFLPRLTFQSAVADESHYPCGYSYSFPKLVLLHQLI